MCHWNLIAAVADAVAADARLYIMTGCVASYRLSVPLLMAVFFDAIKQERTYERPRPHCDILRHFVSSLV